MHELSIAEAVVRVACAHAAGRRVTRVEVKVGHLRQVVASSLSFSFELVALGTPVEGAELALEEVPAAGRCRGCATESRTDRFPLRCRACGGLDLEVTAGEELLVDAIEYDDELATSGGRTHGHS